jgi:hypothetical protein
MSGLPSPRGGARPSKQVARAVEKRRQQELAVFEHGLDAAFLSEIDRLDTQALSDAVKTSLEEEIGVLDWGLERAAGSAAKAELVSRRVAMQSNINSARIARRFGT